MKWRDSRENAILFVPIMLTVMLTERNMMATSRGIVFRTIPMAAAFEHAVCYSSGFLKSREISWLFSSPLSSQEEFTIYVSKDEHMDSCQLEKSTLPLGLNLVVWFCLNSIQRISLITQTSASRLCGVQTYYMCVSVQDLKTGLYNKNEWQSLFVRFLLRARWEKRKEMQDLFAN